MDLHVLIRDNYLMSYDMTEDEFSHDKFDLNITSLPVRLMADDEVGEGKTMRTTPCGLPLSIIKTALKNINVDIPDSVEIYIHDYPQKTEASLE